MEKVFPPPPQYLPASMRGAETVKAELRQTEEDAGSKLDGVRGRLASAQWWLT